MKDPLKNDNELLKMILRSFSQILKIHKNRIFRGPPNIQKNTYSELLSFLSYLLPKIFLLPPSVFRSKTGMYKKTPIKIDTIIVCKITSNRHMYALV